MYLSQRKSYPVADDVRVRYKVLRENMKNKKEFSGFPFVPSLLLYFFYNYCFYIFTRIFAFDF